MISKISGRLIEKKETSLVINVQNFFYEILVPVSVLNRLDQCLDAQGNITLVTYYYFQLEPSRAIPILIGFLNEIERDFFQQFIKVSGIGPRAATKAINKPISEIAKAIYQGDVNFLRTLPGIGLQRAKEIVAKLQGKIGKFGLIQDDVKGLAKQTTIPEWQDEALFVLLQLQYRRQEAMDMIKKALERKSNLQTAEDLLNEIYKQKVRG